MGIVVKQSFWNSVWLYLGIIVGTVNIVLLFPKFLTQDQYGLTRVLVSAAMITSQFAMLGSGSIMIRYLPFFRDEKKHHNGLLFFSLLLCVIGTAFVILIMMLTKGNITAFYENKSTLFVNNYTLLFPLIVFVVFFNIFAAYTRSLLKSVYQLFLKEFFLRVLQTVSLILYYYEVISFEQFVLYFISTYGVITVLITLYVVAMRQMLLRPDFGKFKKPFVKEVSLYGTLTTLAGLSSNLAGYIDIMMIGAMTGVAVAGGNDGLSSVAVYTIGAYVAAVIGLPGRSIQSISLPLVAQAWKENSIEKINELYYKTSLNQILLGILVFIGIWANVDNLFRILPDYSEAKYVILFIGIGKLYDVASGINGGIINTSKYYWFTTVSIGLLAIMIVVTNLILIPAYGIVGAAIATSIAIFLHNLIKMIFLYAKYKIQPFSIKSLVVTILGAAVLAITYLIPQLDSILLDIAVRSTVIIVLYIPLVVTLKISGDFNKLFFKIIRLGK